MDYTSTVNVIKLEYMTSQLIVLVDAFLNPRGSALDV